jgi:hypothetical protein
MIKMAAEIPTNAQQTGIGTLLTTACAAAGAILTGSVGGTTGISVKVTNGWVFDMFLAEGFGGSGKTLMRAVSLPVGVVEAAGLRIGGVTVAAVGAAAVVPIGRGTGVFATGGGGGAVAVVADGGGGVGTVPVGAAMSPTGGFGNGFCATGGRGIVTLPGLGAMGADVDAGSEVGGRGGKLIRTTSFSSGTAASAGRGGKVIRTVSFFGSFASAMFNWQLRQSVSQKFSELSLSIDV